MCVLLLFVCIFFFQILKHATDIHLTLHKQCPTDFYSKTVLYVSAPNNNNNVNTQRFKVGATLETLLDTLMMEVIRP